MCGNQSTADADSMALDTSDVERAHVIKYADGEISWAAQGGDIEEPIGRLAEESIIFIIRQPNSDACLIYSLVEEVDGGHLKLSRLLAPYLPDRVLEKYLITQPAEHLRCNATRELSVVVSTHSGTYRAETFYTSILKPLLSVLGLSENSTASDGEGEGSYELITTQSDHTVKDLGKRIWDITPQKQGSGNRDLPHALLRERTIILLSGDGGIVDLLNGSDQAATAPGNFSGPKPTIALLPLGTGNALFHSLHRPLYTAAAEGKGPSHYVLGLRTLFRGVPAPLPTFEASFSKGSRLISYSDSSLDKGQDEAEEHSRSVTRLVGAIVASYAFHASLVWESDTPAYRKHGDKRFGMAAAELLKLGHAYEADVEFKRLGSQDWTRCRSGKADERFGYVLATLVSSLEKKFIISPASKPLDGKLRVVTFGNIGGTKTMDVMMAAYDNGSHVGMKLTTEDGEEDFVGYDEVEEVSVTVRKEDARWRKVCIDGTIVELPPGGRMLVKTIPESRFDIIANKAVI